MYPVPPLYLFPLGITRDLKKHLQSLSEDQSGETNADLCFVERRTTSER